MDIVKKLELFCEENGIILQAEIIFDDEGLDSQLKYAAYGLLMPSGLNKKSRLTPTINIIPRPGSQFNSTDLPLSDNLPIKKKAI
jgi:hypothetical protein